MTSKLHEVWCEGDPNLDFTATHLGYGKGSSLKEVCDSLSNTNPYFKEHTIWVDTGPYYKTRKVFLSEEEARRAFG